MKFIYRTLEELCEKKVEKRNPADMPDECFWYIDISSVDNVAKKIAAPTQTIGKTASVRARQVVQTNDVLVSTTRPNLNAVAMVPDRLDDEICSTGFCVLKCGEELDPDYLFLQVMTPRFVDALSDLVKGALYPAVTNKQVFARRIPWVPIDDQRRIAGRVKEQLAEVDTARQAVQTQLADFQTLETRLLDHLFSEMDGYTAKKIGEYADTTSGSTPARGNVEYWSPAEVPWVKTAEVAFKPITQTEEGISKKAFQECSVKLLPPKTVLIAMYGQGKTRGQSAILEVEATTNQACFAILPNETWTPEFMQLWLKKSYLDLRTMSEDRGGNQSNLNGGLLKALEVPAPPITEQTRIMEKVHLAMAEVETAGRAAAEQLAEIDLLPQKILSVAFGGAE